MKSHFSTSCNSFKDYILTLTTSSSLENLSEKTPHFNNLQELYEIKKNDITFFNCFTKYKVIDFEEII